MTRSLSVGIDIGTYHVKVVVAQNQREIDKGLPRIVATGFAESKGLRHGYVLNHTDVTQSVELAVRQAEKSAGIKIRKAHVSVGGISLSGSVSTRSVVITRADGNITDREIDEVSEASRGSLPQSASQNRKIIHTIPIQYKIDGKVALGNPIGMKGSKLEAKSLSISVLEHHADEIISAVENAGIIVEELVASPIAASIVTLTKTQKIAGCLLANIGSETVSIVVYENGIPVSLEVFPIGSNDITNDIALGLKIPLEEAEEVKRGSLIGASYPKKKLDEIVTARLSDIFELIEAHLKKINRNELLPAGIVLTGGGASIETIAEFAKTTLKLPSRIAPISLGDKNKAPIRDASWSVAYGLSIIALTADDESETLFPAVSKTFGKIISWIKQFLP